MKILVVGGGIIGCACAWELAKAGCAVTLLERAEPGAEASSAAAGLLSPLGESSRKGFARLALESWRLYPGVVAELRERTGLDPEHVTRGTLYPLSAVEGLDPAAWGDDPEFRVELLEGRAVQAREPALSPRVRRALFVAGHHWINNQRLVTAYARAALAAGVGVETGVEVTDVLVEGGRVRGVRTADGRREGDLVLLAAGAWTGQLTAALGARLPVEPRRGQMVALAHVPPVLTHCVHGEVYVVPRPSGEVLVGATVERVGFQRAVTAEGIGGLLAAAVALVPSLGERPIVRTWSGFRPAAPDDLPILGPWPGVPGLWVATAHFRNGILLAPITARVMRDWIVEGRPGLDVTDFLPDRFVRRGP
jgi:glycine oxidase